MSPEGADARVLVHGFPRVSGDEPVNAIAGGTKETFSPRERG